LVQGLQNQELFGNGSTPVVSKNTSTDKGKGKKKPKQAITSNNINSGVPLRRSGGARQFIFNPDPEQCSSRDLLNSTEAPQPEPIEIVEVDHQIGDPESEELWSTRVR